MPSYRFISPPGWISSPYPPPQKGVYLRARPGEPQGSILLMERLKTQGSLEEQLEQVLLSGCADSQILDRLPLRRINAAACPAMVAGALLHPRHLPEEVREMRVFALLDVPEGRLPLVFIGGPDAFLAHQLLFRELIISIRPAIAGDLADIWND